MLSVKALSSWLQIILNRRLHNKRNEKGSRGSPQNTYYFSKKIQILTQDVLWPL